MARAHPAKLIFVLFWLFFLKAGAAAQEPKIKIGVSTELTGEAATYGLDIKNTLLFANQKLGAGRFELLIEDDRCNGRDATSVAQKLVNIDKVKYVIGYGCSGALLAAAPIFEKAHVIAIGTGTAAPAVSQAGDYIFRTWPSDLTSAQVLYPYIAARHKRLGMVSEETEFAQGLYNALAVLNQGRRLSILNENYLPDTTDFRTMLLKLQSEKADGLLINSQSERGFVAIYKQLLEMSWHVPVYGNYQPDTALFLKTFGPHADGIVFADTPFADQDQITSPAGMALYNEFKAQYGAARSQPFVFVTAYAAFAALAEAILSGQDVKEYLYTHSFNQIVPNLSFDKNGDSITLSNVLKTIKNGRVRPLRN